MDYLNYTLMQVGLLMAATGAIAIVHFVGELNTRPPAYYFYSVYASALTCMFGFAWYCNHPIRQVTFVAPALSLVWGAEHILVAFYYKTQRGAQLSIPRIRRLNVIVGWATSTFFLIAVVLAVNARLNSIEQKADKLADKVQAGSPDDTAEVKRLRAKVDSQTTLLAANAALITSLQKQSAQMGSQIQQLTGLVNQVLNLMERLQLSIRRVDANVERTRKATPPVRPLSLPPPTYWVDPNKVRRNTY